MHTIFCHFPPPHALHLATHKSRGTLLSKWALPARSVGCPVSPLFGLLPPRETILARAEEAQAEPRYCPRVGRSVVAKEVRPEEHVPTIGDQLHGLVELELGYILHQPPQLIVLLTVALGQRQYLGRATGPDACTTTLLTLGEA